MHSIAVMKMQLVSFRAPGDRRCVSCSGFVHSMQHHKSAGHSMRKLTNRGTLNAETDGLSGSTNFILYLLHFRLCP